MNQDSLIELVASSRKTDVAEAAAILKRESIPFETDVPEVETRSSQVFGEISGPKYFLSVKLDDFAAGWKALENEYARAELPDDHYLLDSDDDEIREILEEPRKWSPFDTAHAKMIAKERGIEFSNFDESLVDDAKEAAKAKYGRRTVISVAFFFLVVLYLVRKLLLYRQ